MWVKGGGSGATSARLTEQRSRETGSHDQQAQERETLGAGTVRLCGMETRKRRHDTTADENSGLRRITDKAKGIPTVAGGDDAIAAGGAGGSSC